MKYKKLKNDQDSVQGLEEMEKVAELNQIHQPWLPLVSSNSLKEAAKLHLNKTLDKSDRDVFVVGDITDVIENFQQLMTYCSKDVETTFELFQKLFPRYLEKCPSDVTFNGILEMSRGFLPVTEEWLKYIQRSDSLVENYQTEIETDLKTAVELALKTLKTKKYESDAWLKHLDWTIPISRSKNQIKRLALDGKPKWYCDLWDPKLERVRLTTRQRVTPYLLKLSWNNCPLFFSKKMGWTFVSPKSRILNEKFIDPDDSDADLTISGDQENYYYRLPHKDGILN